MPQPSPFQTHSPEDPQKQSINGEGEENNSRTMHSQGGREYNEQKGNGGISHNWQSGYPHFSQFDDELTLLAVLNSKRIHGMRNFGRTCSSSCGRTFPLYESLDQTSEAANGISHRMDFNEIDSSELGLVLVPDRLSIGYPSRHGSLSTSMVISRRDPFPFLEAITRTIHRGSPQASQLDHVGVRSRSSFSRLFYHHLLHAQIPRGLSNVIQRSSLPALGQTFRSENSPALLGHATSTSSEVELQNEVDMRQQYVQTVLFMNMLGYGILDGSLSLRLTTTDSRRQDILILGQSPVSNSADLHEQHYSMRLDVDNMSYEELLDLDDRIGNVSTGLSEEVVSKFLKHRKNFLFLEENALKESCSICQEEYAEEDELATLECGHKFHVDCITQWLRYKISALFVN